MIGNQKLFVYGWLITLGLALSGSAFAQTIPTINTVVGTSGPVTGNQASATFLGNAAGVVSDGAGGFYISSSNQHAIYHVRGDGVLRVVAGTGIRGFSGDGGPATAATLAAPQGIALDGSGNLFIADSGNIRIRKITPAGIITTVAGNGGTGFSGDGGLATSAQFSQLLDVAVDNAGNLLIADTANVRIRKVTPAGVISTFAGSGPAANAGGGGFSGDGGPATAALLNNPRGVAVDGAGNVFIADATNRRVRRVSTDGTITTVAGGGNANVDSPGAVATQANLPLTLSDVTLDSAGNIFVVSGSAVLKVSTNGTIARVAGGVSAPSYGGDGGPATSARLDYPDALSADNLGNLLIADTRNYRIRSVTPQGLITTVAGSALFGFGGDGGPAGLAQLYEPSDVAIDRAGNLYIADPRNSRVRKVTPDGIVTTVAGAANGFSGDGGPATQARLSLPNRIAVDATGNLFISDSVNRRIRKVSPDGIITTIAGNGGPGFYNGDGKSPLETPLPPPGALAVGPTGDLYFVITGPDAGIRRISNGTLVKVATTDNPFAIDSQGNLYFTNDVYTETPYVTQLIKQTPDGNRIALTHWSLTWQVNGMAAAGDSVFVNMNNGGLAAMVLKVSANGSLSTVAGSSVRRPGFSGDGGPATAGQIAGMGLALDDQGNVYMADSGNHRIRKVSFQSQPVTFSIENYTALSLVSAGTGSAVQVGYGAIRPGAGSNTPSGVAIFGFRQNGVLVSEAGVPASPLIQSGRIYAEVRGPVNTGLAIANPGSQPAAISFFFTGPNGDFSSGTTTIPANGQIAAFLNQAPFNGGDTLSGAFTFNSSTPIAVVALRGFTNERGEFLLTTLPVLDLTQPPSTGNVVFPHFAAGGGWTTEIALVNPSEGTLTGTVQFLTQAGLGAAVVVNGQSNNTFPYSIPPRTSQTLQAAGGSAVVPGSVRISPATGTAAPSGLAIFSFKNGGVTVSEAGVPAGLPGTTFRLYSEVGGIFGRPGSIQTGLAIANHSASTATVIMSLTRLDGSPVGLIGTLAVPRNGQTAFFLNQNHGFSTLQGPFQGLLYLSSTAPVSVVGLRGRYNERSDFLITTTPPANEAAPAANAELFFPHIVDSGGYTTQFILYGGRAGSFSGSMPLRTQSGAPVIWPLQ